MTEESKELMGGEAAKADAAKADAAKADPAKADAAKADAAKADAAKADPAKADPAKADAAKADPAKAEDKPDLLAELGKLGLDSATIELFKPLEASLDKEGVAKLAEAGRLMKERETKQQDEFWKTQNDTWLKEIEADKTFGGEHMEANAVKVNTLLNKMKSGPALVEYLKKTNHGNCAPLFKLLAEVSTHFQEDFFVQGGDSGGIGGKPAHVRMGYKAVDEY